MYLHYTIRELADDLCKSEMTIKNALAALERARLIERRRQRNQRVNCIYVLLAEWTENCPQEDRKLSAQETKNCPPGERNLSAAQTENCPSHGQKTVCDTDRKLSPNRNNRERIKRERTIKLHFAAKRTLEQLLKDTPDKTLHHRQWKKSGAAFCRI